MLLLDLSNTEHTMYKNSPMQAIQFRQYKFLVKRDDLLNEEFSGNKSRKLYHYLINDFPEITTIVSYGGNQSNLMYSLSCLAKLKNWKFIYYTKPLPQQLKHNPQGNLLAALQNQMQLIELVDFNENLIIHNVIKPNELLIHQGALQIEAELGLAQLASEILDYTKLHNFDKFHVFIPSGTGASALYLQKHLPENTVFTTNCIGDVDYLIQQFSTLEINTHMHPQILPRNKRYVFGKPCLELWDIYQELKCATKIEFDLLYDPIGWMTILDNIDKFIQPIIYIHCGGLLGNQSMLQRYNYLLADKHT